MESSIDNFLNKLYSSWFYIFSFSIFFRDPRHYQACSLFVASLSIPLSPQQQVQFFFLGPRLFVLVGRPYKFANKTALLRNSFLFAFGGSGCFGNFQPPVRSFLNFFFTEMECRSELLRLYCFFVAVNWTAEMLSFALREDKISRLEYNSLNPGAAVIFSILSTFIKPKKWILFKADVMLLLCRLILKKITWYTFHIEYSYHHICTP